MRSRPDVDLQMPTVVHPGDEVPVQMVVTSRSNTPIDFIELSFKGFETFSAVANAAQTTRARKITTAKFRLREQGILNEGEHRFEVKLQVPRDAPSSYVGVHILIRYEVKVHISIPWWPDLREVFELLVEAHGSPRPQPKPWAGGSGQRDRPVIEISLSDTSFAPGDEVTGAFAVGNALRQGQPAVEIAIVASERSGIGSFSLRSEQFRHIAPLPLKHLKEGVEVPFRFHVPREAVPSFESPWCKLAWEVEAAMDTGTPHPVLCRVPVTICRYSAAHHDGRPRPKVGAERWRRAWAEAGEAHGLTLREERFALRGSRGEVEIEVARDDGHDEAMLVATLRYPSLDLNLRAARQFFIVLPSPLELLLPGCKVEHRELAQARAFFTEPLRAALLAFKHLRIDDTRTVVRSPGGGVDKASITAFLEKTSALATALSEAIAAIPPPASMRDALPAWSAFAHSTGGRLAIGSMSIFAASIDGAVLDVVTKLGERGEALGTRIEVEIDPPLDYRIDMKDEASFAAAPPGCRDFAVALRASAKDLVVSDHAVALELAERTHDPADLRMKMSEMLTLARRLRGDLSPGPYR